MESPNRITNRNSGSHEVTAPVDSNPSSDSRWPSWKIQITTPYAAPTDSRLSRIALIGITIDRNVTSRRANAIANTNANTTGTRSCISWLKSSDPAVNPVTLVCVPGTRSIAQVRQRPIRGVVGAVPRDRDVDGRDGAIRADVDCHGLLEVVASGRLGA